MSIQKDFTVRYRDEGHVRFQIPEQLCDKGVANLLTARILKLEAVYRVKVFRNQRKLSINYQPTICEFGLLAKQLFQLLTELEQQGLLVAKVVNEVGSKKQKQRSFKARFGDWKTSRWAKKKYGDAKETVQAAKVITRMGMKKPKAFINDPESAIIDFFNDILVLYLIKIHWSRITKEWIPSPWVHRYHWTAVFYLFYLLIRSRKPK